MQYDFTDLIHNGKSLIDEINEAARKWYNFFVIKDIKLYHYTSQRGLEGILSNNALWFTDAANLNDTSEGKYIFTLLDDFLSSYSKGQEFEIFKQEIRKSIIEIEDKYIFSYTKDNSGMQAYNMFPHYFICSFCKEGDALALWNYYSKSENKIGYNIKFSLGELRKSIRKSFNSILELSVEFRVYKVLYSLKRQKRLLREVLDFFYAKWKGTHAQSTVLFNLAQYLHAIKFAVKHPAFAPEKEVRIIVKVIEENFDLSSGKIQVRAIDDGFIPYISVPFEKSNIKHIKTSPLTDNYESAKYVLQKYGYSGIEIDKSDIPLRF